MCTTDKGYVCVRACARACVCARACGWEGTSNDDDVNKAMISF
jgi:hypothetical protein